MRAIHDADNPSLACAATNFLHRKNQSGWRSDVAEKNDARALRDPGPKLFNEILGGGHRGWDGLLFVHCASLAAEKSPRAIKRAVLVIRRENFIAGVQVQTARDDIQSRRRVRHVNQVLRIRADVSSERSARVAHQFVESAPQEFDWLIFQLALPRLISFKYGARSGAERTVIQKNDMGIEQKQIWWEWRVVGKWH